MIIISTMVQITEVHLSEAAKMLGKQILDSVAGGRQAMLLSDQSYLHRFALGSVNRDVNMKWVQKLKIEMSHLIMARERTTLTACIDLREVQRAVEEQTGATDFQATLLDGQHRFMALKELYEENPTCKYDFWVQVYIVSSENEMMRLIEDFDKRLIISAKDKKVMEDRRLFSEAFSSLVPKGHHHRRCVTGTINHKVLREEAIMNVIQKGLTKEKLMELMQGSAKEYKQVYEMNPPKPNSVLAKVIEDTKLYQLVAWESGEWIRKMFTSY